uniref:Uncharacterized protein n=1 Tax=Cacopsylla melanoneura TaxID=428564 RepID=A0A8D8T9R1_9HEMI
MGFAMFGLSIALIFAVLSQNLLIESANIPPGKKVVYEKVQVFNSIGSMICIPTNNTAWCKTLNLTKATDPALCGTSYSGAGSFSANNEGACKEGGYCDLQLTLSDPFSAEVVCAATIVGGVKCTCYVYGPM